MALINPSHGLGRTDECERIVGCLGRVHRDLAMASSSTIEPRLRFARQTARPASPRSPRDRGLTVALVRKNAGCRVAGIPVGL